MFSRAAHHHFFSARVRSSLKSYGWATLVFSTICGLGGYRVANIYGVVTPLWGLAQGAFIGVFIGSSYAGIYTFYLESPRGHWFRQLPFLATMTMRFLVTLLIVMLSIRLAPIIFPHLSDGNFSWMDKDTSSAVILASLAVFIFSLVTEISRLLGRGVLGNFVRGRYHHPREEDLTLLYIDIIGSTGMAERIGPTAFHALLDTFARDLGEVVLEHGGQIHKYVGDGIIVTWPDVSETSRNSAIECYFEFKSKIAHRSKYYASKFGQAPEFRGALHGGTVVVGEMGDLKREIVYLGDPVNTVSRILSMAGERQEDFLVSTEMLNTLELPEELTARRLGSSNLRGRKVSIELSSLSLQETIAHPDAPGAGRYKPLPASLSRAGSKM